MTTEKTPKKNKSTQVKESLRELINQPGSKHGDILPSERKLGEQFNVSRITIRKAMEELESEGLIYRIRGKGSFICVEKIPQKLNLLTSYSEDMRERKLAPDSLILDINSIIANSYISNKLQIQTNDPVYILRRLRLADGEPMAIENCYMRQEIGAIIAETITNGTSLYKLFATKCDITLYNAYQTIEVARLTNWERQLLGRDSPIAALLTKRQTFDTNNQVVEYVESKYRSDRYLFHVELFAYQPSR
ncbi:MAG: GntR family transcriptional regulator [Anaerolineaceae bacterium]|jgi:GntR family transcriptional regulator|nr:MAG: GntR family transcriptional regulator [Anaerolineaceae bacterium]